MIVRRPPPGRPARRTTGSAPGAGDLVQVGRLAIGQLVMAVPGDGAVPAVAEGGEEREPGVARVDGQDVRRRLRQADVGEHDRPQHGPAGEGKAERGPYSA